MAILTFGLAVTSVLLGMVALPHLHTLVDTPYVLDWRALTVMVVLSEVLVIHLEAKGEALTITFSEVPIVVGLVLAAPGDIVLARLLGAGLTLAFHRRQSLRKLSFNLAMMALETLLALLVHRAVLGGADPLSVRGGLAAIAATLTAWFFGILAVTAVISLYSGRPSHGVTQRVVLAGTTSAVVNTGLGLAFAASMSHEEWLAIPLGGVALAAFLVYRSYFSLSQRYASLASLHDFTRVVGRSLDLPTVSQSVLSSARELLRARRAALLLLGADADGAVLVRDDDEATTFHPLSAAAADALLAAILPGQPPRARLVEGSELLTALGDLSAKDAMAAPVYGEHGTVGFVLVADRLAAVSTFDLEDLKLLETLVNHAGVSLENVRLFRRLQDEAASRTHQALHDSLTGLPNRQLLTERVAEGLAARETGNASLAILLIDLESFKEVNETLGHEAGDMLLCRISQRVIDAVPAGSLLARFGGDEFALLLPEVADEAATVAIADHLLVALEAPFTDHDQGLALNVGATIGVALSPVHGRDAATLLQRAEVALFNAKGTHAGVEVYTPESDPFTPQRLALAGELRQAIGRREIEVHYQPKVDLRSGLVVGAEALVRWHHPRRGMLEPTEFIPAAERTGVIRPLTIYVLRCALEKCKGWRDAGLDLSVAVNLSVRNLLDPELAGDVLELLVAYSLPPETLTLEITESSIMTDSRRSIGALSQLHEMGVQLSIDDFGTGYSSFSYLRHLPVSEIKIDRSFVSNITVDANDAAIVHHTIQLGHQLGLRVVAEGAESRDDLDRLAELGCDEAQGYVISRPRSGPRMDAWLLQQNVARLAPVPPLVLPATAVHDVAVEADVDTAVER